MSALEFHAAETTDATEKSRIGRIAAQIKRDAALQRAWLLDYFRRLGSLRAEKRSRVRPGVGESGPPHIIGASQSVAESACVVGTLTQLPLRQSKWPWRASHRSHQKSPRAR
jgi:hypothetical protein